MKRAGAVAVAWAIVVGSIFGRTVQYTTAERPALLAGLVVIVLLPSLLAYLAGRWGAQ